MRHKVDDEKRIKKQVMLFLLICLPVTWILMGVAFGLSKTAGIQASPKGYTLYMLACFLPAVSAVVCCVVSKENIRSLNFMPKFQGNGKVYVAAVLIGILISLTDVPLITILFFKEAGSLHHDVTIPMIVFQILLYTAIGCLQFYVLMGEEIGWMGFLFPRLETLCGTNLAIVLTGVIRGLWHIVVLWQNEKFVQNLVLLCITNIFGGCLFVLVTKKSGSVVPAAIIHALSNTLPAVMRSFIVLDEVNYEKKEMLINVLSNVPYFVIMIVCWYLLMKTLHRDAVGKESAYERKVDS